MIRLSQKVKTYFNILKNGFNVKYEMANDNTTICVTELTLMESLAYKMNQ